MDPLALLVLLLQLSGVPSTRGAAPGHTDDGLCGDCHSDIAATYQHVGMAKSFYKPRASNAIEDFDAPPFFHAPSQQYFAMQRRGGDLVFRRWKLAADGAPIHLFEQKVDWILGSGHHARTYLYRTPGGDLWQLPIAWYTATREWNMAPGFDRQDHEGVTRRVRHECMFCHNAYPEIAADRLSYWRAQTFPTKLPEGIGCQRCHGPGAAHASAATRGAAADEVRKAIVNPAKLDARRRMDICYGCHMQPAVALVGSRKPGRDIYSFRPGELLADYAPLLDVVENDLPRGERFEINHHPYRLEQSACFIKSEGRLSCLTCHNPHRKITAENRAAHYRKACMSCHAQPHFETRDCTSCHMPPRRPQDVVHVVMTDHFIRRTPAPPQFLAPRAERDPAIDGVEFLYSSDASNGELYRLIPLLRANATRGVERLERAIDAAKPAEVEPYLDLASAQMRLRRFAPLERTAQSVLDRDPKNALALEWLGVARAARLEDPHEAIRGLERSLASDPSRPEAEYNLGIFLAARGRTQEAINHYGRALAIRPNMTAAWIRLGDAQRDCGDLPSAAEAYQRALAIDPDQQRALEGLAKTRH